MSKQHTAVDYLVEKLIKLGYLHSENYGQSQVVKKVIEQSKAMEKVQHENTWVFALTYGIETMKGLNDLSSKNAFEQYYNQTFKSE